MICQTAWERRERENNSHELSVTFLSEEEKLSRGKESSQTDTLFTFGADIPLVPRCSCRPPSVNGPHAAVMTSSGVNSGASRGLVGVQCCGCQVFNYQPSSPAPNPTASMLTDLTHAQACGSLPF